jgi:hypothetical protein
VSLSWLSYYNIPHKSVFVKRQYGTLFSAPPQVLCQSFSAFFDWQIY